MFIFYKITFYYDDSMKKILALESLVTNKVVHDDYSNVNCMYILKKEKKKLRICLCFFVSRGS